jgi:uncharacterized membrane protein
MVSICGLKRGIGWTLIAVCALTAASLHHHVSLVDLAGPEYSAGSEARVVTSHSPLSTGSHCHRVVQTVDDNCLACHSQRTVSLLPAGPAALESLAATSASPSPTLAPAASLAVTCGARAPPALA